VGQCASLGDGERVKGELPERPSGLPGGKVKPVAKVDVLCGVAYQRSCGCNLVCHVPKPAEGEEALRKRAVRGVGTGQTERVVLET